MKKSELRKLIREEYKKVLKEEVMKKSDLGKGERKLLDFAQNSNPKNATGNLAAAFVVAYTVAQKIDREQIPKKVLEDMKKGFEDWIKIEIKNNSK